MTTIINAPSELISASIVLGRFGGASEQRAISGKPHRHSFGTGHWTLQIGLHDMTQADAAAMLAWCDRLMEADAVARLPRPDGTARIGTTSAQSLTASAANAGAIELGLAGLGDGLTLGAGSLISISDRMHRITQEVFGDNAAALIWPSLREAVSDGAVVQIGDGVTGLWTLSPETKAALSNDWERQDLLASGWTLQFGEYW